jgi:uncharacterized protein YciI
MSTIYIVILTYIGPIEDIDAQVSGHVEWLKKGYTDGVFLASGRRVPRNGGVILVRGGDLATVEARMRDDPFQRLGLARVEIFPFEASMMVDELTGII